MSYGGPWGEIDHEYRGSVQRVIITKVDDSGPQQLVDYDAGADVSHTEVLRIQPFGFSSNPPKESEGIMLTLNVHDAPLVLGGELPDKRPTKLKSGAAKVYDINGASITFDGDGNATIKTNGATVSIGKDGAITLKGSGITIDGPLTVKGDITHTGNMTTSGTHTDANGKHA